MKAGVLAETALVGREHELEELMHCLEAAIEGKGTTVFVSGEAGSGKTRLIRELINAAQKKSVATLSGWCLSDAEIPYFPFVEAFSAYFASIDQEEQPMTFQQQGTRLEIGGAPLAGSAEREITTLLTGPGITDRFGKPQALSPQVWKDKAFATVARTLHAISAERPIILFIEDIQWADSASLALLHYVARSVKRSARILVLATYRSEELTADVEGYPHPLSDTLRMMNREDLFTEIKLSNLGHAEIGKIAENMMGGILQGEFAEKLGRESRGNPLFVVESLRMLSEQKSLIRENDEWRLAVDELGIPSKVRDIILRRLANLKYAQRRVLDAASVIGEKFDVELLSNVLGLDSLEILETLNVIAHSTSLVSAEENFYKFDHARSRETLYEALSPPLKKGYHARVAQRLESSGKGKLPLSEIAHHYIAAGNEEKAVKFAIAAGQDALARFSNAEAIKHFTYVLEKASSAPTNAETKSTVLEKLGDAYYANSMFKKALELFEQLADSETGEVKLRAYRKAMDSVIFGSSDQARLSELVRKAEPYASSSRLESARIRILSSTYIHVEMLEDYEGALRVFEEEYSVMDVARVLVPYGAALMQAPMRRRGMGAFLRSIALWGDIGDLHGLIDAIFNAGFSLYISGAPFQETWDMLVRALQIGEKIGDYSRVSGARWWLGLSADSIGRLEEAISQIQKALETSKLTDAAFSAVFFNQHGMVYAVLAKLYAKLGDLKSAEEYWKIGIASPRVYRSEFPIIELLFVLGQAVLFAAKNCWKEAEQWFEKSFEMAKPLSKLTQAELGRDYVWALKKQGREEEAKLKLEEINKLFAEVEKDFAQLNLEASLMAPRLVTAGEEFEMRLDIANVSRKKGQLTKAENVIPPEFAVTAQSAKGSLQNSSFNFIEGSIGAFQVATVKLGLKALKEGAFTLRPLVTYMDDLGETKTCKSNAVTVTVQSAKPAFELLPHRLPTGYAELDALLFGGIPENLAVVLSSPANDEREMLIKRFLEAGAKAGETTFYLTVEPGNAKTLAENHSTNFFLFACNPQADAMTPSTPNIFKLKGLENLTDIDISLTKAFRNFSSSAIDPKRICINILSDVLLQHHAITTRRWLASLLPTLKSKNFTTLAVVNPRMHTIEDFEAVLGLFEGEISILDKETEKGTARFLKINKMTSQKYFKDETPLTEEQSKKA